MRVDGTIRGLGRWGVGLLCLGWVVALGGAELEGEGTRVASALPPLPGSPEALAVGVARSPVERFRQLLLMPAADRARAVEAEPAMTREGLRAKLREYEALDPEERDRRLRVTQLRWYLVPLMQVVPTNRAPVLAVIPQDIRALVARRLEEWDLLAPGLQADVLRFESTLHYFVRLESSGPEQRVAMAAGLSEDRRASMESTLEQFRGLSEVQQRRMFERFTALFLLGDAERERVLAGVPPGERSQLGATLEWFRGVPESDRRDWFAGFQAFAAMSRAERSVFLKQAERWKTMTSDERGVWRRMMASLPPVPPGMESIPVPPGSRPASSPLPALPGSGAGLPNVR